MKRNRYVLYAVLIAGVALLLAGVAIVYVPKGLSPTEEIQPPKTNPYDEMKGHIEKARGVALELGKFTWDEFAAAGLLPPPGGTCALGNRVGEREQFDESSGCNWVTLPEMLPRPESAGPLVIYCDTSLNLAEKVRATRPSDNSTLPEWLELCGQLQSTLRGAEHLASNYKNTNRYALAKMEEGINNSDAVIKQKYLEKFQSKSAKYLGLLDDFISSFQQAEQAASQLANWQYADASTSEE